MNTVAALLLCLAPGALFDVTEIPVDDPRALCFMAEGHTGRADLMVLSGNQLSRYPSADPERGQILRLDLGTSAFDIADLDGDEIPELIAVQGQAIKRLAYGAEAEAAVTLFEMDTLFSASSTPFPYVLVTTYEGESVLALPQHDALELRSLDGSLSARFPVGRDAPESVTFGSPFPVRPVDPVQVAGPGGIEFRISAVIAHRPVLPEELAPGVEPMGTAYRYGTQRQARESLHQPPHLWPWFPLTTDGASRDRALYALEDSHATIVRIQEESGALSGAIPRLGPPRRYPGRVLASAGLFPDFNGDGLTDLLLWDAPEPTPSVGTLTRALATRNWPLRLTVHLFDPQRRRFAPKPAAVLQMRPPVGWYLERLGWPPIRHVVLADFDGDGRTDLACSGAPRSYSVWCWGEVGFGADPDFAFTLGEEVSEVAFQADVEGRGCTSVGLRGKSVIYVLRARPETTEP